MSKRIMFVGGCGIGKSSLGKYVGKREDVGFICGSMWDLLGGSEGVWDNEILWVGWEGMYKGDFEVVKKRNRLLKDRE